MSEEVEEIEVTVQPSTQAISSAERDQPLTQVLHTLLLAGIGAVAEMTERSAHAQHNREKMLHTLATQLKPKSSIEHIEAQLETRFEQFLNRLNIPSMRNIDDLNAKVAQLHARVEESQRNQK